MKSDQILRKSRLILWKTAWFAVLVTAAVAAATQRTAAATNVVVWDTGSRLADAGAAEDRNGWKAVPPELFVFEDDPSKASSDPGYYGREYAFKGDAVVENRSLAAVFWSAKGRVVLYAEGDAGASSPGG